MSDVTVFAKVAGQAAQYDYSKLILDLPVFPQEPVENDPLVALSYVPLTADHAALPELTADQAKEVAEACYHSGAYLDVAARVLKEKGDEQFQTYCEFQSYEGMRKSFWDMPDTQRKWLHSGLTPA